VFPRGVVLKEEVWERHRWRNLFQSGGGAQVHATKTKEIFVVWIGNCDVTSIEIWRNYLYTIWRSKLHYLDKIL